MFRVSSLLALLLAFVLLATACGDDSSDGDDAGVDPDGVTDDADGEGDDGEGDDGEGDDGEGDDGEGDDGEGDDGEGDDDVPPVFTEEDLLDVTTATFSDPTTVDNRFFPLVPGTRHVLEGTALEDDELIERKVIAIVTDLTKVIKGVETVVLWERDFNDDLLLESELAFFAQDDDGNVWHFGQYSEIYDEDELVGGRIWLVDLPEGARAGIAMPADPQPGAPSYSQGWAPAPFNWTDRAAADEIGAETCVDDGETCFTDVLITAESDDEEPGAAQLKYYAPGVGNVRVGFRGPDSEEEEMELVEDGVLSADELDEVRAEALELEERAGMYAMTNPLQRSG